MKIWILRPIDVNSATWEPWYDKAFGFVVAAQTETEARELSASECGDEGEAAWLHNSESSCQELIAGVYPGIIMRDFQAA